MKSTVRLKVHNSPGVTGLGIYAIVLGAATQDMWTWRGSLTSLATAVLPPTSAAGTIVIGSVAGLQLLKGLTHVYA